MFVDASALCAILLDEPEAQTFLDRLDEESARMTSPVAIMETGLRLMREGGGDLTRVLAQIAALLSTADIEVVPIRQADTDMALGVYARFGKGRHPALLFKGDDFTLTDIEPA